MSFSIDDMFEGATEPTPGLTFIGPGNHPILTLADFTMSAKGHEAPKYRADFVVIQSDHHKQGELVSKTFQPYSTAFKGAGQKEAGELMVLVQHLNGLPLGDRVGAMAEMKKMLDPAQPARGFRVAASGYDKPPKPNADGSPKLDKNGQPKGPYTIVSFFPAAVANTAAQVASDRAKIEAMPQMQSRAQAAQAPAAAPPAAPVAQAPAAPVATVPPAGGTVGW